MPDIRGWISQVKRETSPDYWPDVRRWEGSGSPPASGGLRFRRVVALATGVAVGALALVLAVEAFQQPPALGPPPSAAKSNGIVAFLRTDPRQAIREGELPEMALFVVGPQGGDVERIVSRVEGSATWSPDGTRIAYVRGGELHTIDIDSRTSSLLIVCDAPCQRLGTGAWSADGTRIAYRLQTARGLELWVRDVDGAGARMLRDDVVFEAPSWSPNGRLLAVSGRIGNEPDSENDGIFVIDAESGSLVRTIELSGLDPGSTVDWSPDGEWLVFDAIGEGGVDYGVPSAEAGAGIYLIRPDGTDRRLLTSSSCEENACTALHPEWSPDGEEVAFTRSLPELGNNGSLGDLYIIDVDTVDTRRITGGPGLDCCAAWQPLSPGQEVPSIASADCPTSPFRVSSLPWLEPGSPIPAPERLTEASNSFIAWFEDPQDRWAGRYVVLGRSSEAPIDEDLTGFPRVSVRGTAGRLVWIGDPGVGQLSLVWREDDERCSWHTLSISSLGLTSEQAERSIQRIAESLEGGSSGAACATPEIHLDRRSARPGERVSFDGECVPEDWDHGYGLFLLHDSPSCELIAGGLDLHMDVEPNGDATGSFMIPPVGFCFQPSASSPRALPPGTYTLGLGCHACLLPETTIRIEGRRS